MPFLYSDAQEMWDVLNGDDGKQFIDAVGKSNLGVRTLSGMMQVQEAFIRLNLLRQYKICMV